MIVVYLSVNAFICGMSPLINCILWYFIEEYFEWAVRNGGWDGGREVGITSWSNVRTMWWSYILE
jgi:hypothetical protein